MKKLFVTICALALVVPAVNAADLKIGYVTVDKVLADAPQVKAINDAMLERFGGKKKELESMEGELKTMQENYKRNELVMTEDKLDEMKNSMIGKLQAYKQQEAVLAQEVNTMRSQELATLRESMRTIIEEIAKEGKYDLVLSEGVVYGNDKLDISDKVLDRLKKAFKKK
ncbi:MAG: OmpH family outer membrane protein [Gammaproteobacteria bacterium]